jgi:hypothetical protein
VLQRGSNIHFGLLVVVLVGSLVVTHVQRNDINAANDWKSFHSGFSNVSDKKLILKKSCPDLGIRTFPGCQ